MGKYLKQLSNEEIESFLESNNYIVCHDLTTLDGKSVLPGIERSDDLVFLRCRKKILDGMQEYDKQVALQLLKKHPGFMSLAVFGMPQGSYYDFIHLIALRDFDASIIGDFFDDENGTQLLDSYLDFMLERFKNQGYQDALLNYVDEFLAENPEDEREMQ